MTERSEWYDRQGNAISYERYCELRPYDERREAAITVARTRVGEQEISTVWLGTNHSYGNGPPLIFETLVFPECDICERYSTETQALAGHDQIVARVRAEQRVEQ